MGFVFVTNISFAVSQHGLQEEPDVCGGPISNRESLDASTDVLLQGRMKTEM